MFAKCTMPIIWIGMVMSISTAILAQAPVEDRSVSAGRTAAGQPVLTESASVQLYVELQTLRQEVTELRGMIEELGYQLEQLSTRQTNDYANLDRRILETGQSGTAPSPGANSSSTVNTTGTPPAATAAGGSAATQLYNQAFASLRSGDREAALRQFDELVTNYPNDAVAGDALYWMGETQWVGAAYEKAREAFVALTDRFPDHRRFGDALYKLGLIYHQLGDNASSRQYLQRAVALGGDVGARAEEFLSQNLSQ